LEIVDTEGVSHPGLPGKYKNKRRAAYASCSN